MYNFPQPTPNIIYLVTSVSYYLRGRERRKEGERGGEREKGREGENKNTIKDYNALSNLGYSIKMAYSFRKGVVFPDH